MKKLSELALLILSDIKVISSFNFFLQILNQKFGAFSQLLHHLRAEELSSVKHGSMQFLKYLKFFVAFHQIKMHVLTLVNPRFWLTRKPFNHFSLIRNETLLVCNMGSFVILKC